MNKELALHSDAQKVTEASDALADPHVPAATDSCRLKIPSLWIRGHYFYCDGEALSFRHSGRKLALLKAFLAAANYRLNREQVIAHVHCEERWHQHTSRFIACLNMNILRTISDTRRQLYISFAHLYPGIDWLPFSRATKDWRLLRFKEDYVLSQLQPKIY